MGAVPSKTYTRDDLNERQAAWLDRYLEYGGNRSAATKAVEEVYGYTHQNAKAYASQLIRNPKIRAVLGESVTVEAAAAAVVAGRELANMVSDGLSHGQTVKPADKIKAAKILLDRGAGAVAQKVIHEGLDGSTAGSFAEALKGLTDVADALPTADRKELAAVLRNLADNLDPPEVIDAATFKPPALLTPLQKHSGGGKASLGLGVPNRRLPGQDYSGVDRYRAEKKRKRLEQFVAKREESLAKGDKWSDVDYSGL